MKKVVERENRYFSSRRLRAGGRSNMYGPFRPVRGVRLRSQRCIRIVCEWTTPSGRCSRSRNPRALRQVIAPLLRSAHPLCLMSAAGRARSPGQKEGAGPIRLGIQWLQARHPEEGRQGAPSVPRKGRVDTSASVALDTQMQSRPARGRDCNVLAHGTQFALHRVVTPFEFPLQTRGLYAIRMVVRFRSTVRPCRPGPCGVGSGPRDHPSGTRVSRQCVGLRSAPGPARRLRPGSVIVVQRRSSRSATGTVARWWRRNGFPR